MFVLVNADRINPKRTISSISTELMKGVEEIVGDLKARFIINKSIRVNYVSQIPP